MTFPFKDWVLLGYENQYKFRDLVMDEVYDTCNPSTIVEFAERIKKKNGLMIGEIWGGKYNLE